MPQISNVFLSGVTITGTGSVTQSGPPPSNIGFFTITPFNGNGGNLSVTDLGSGTFLLDAPANANNGEQVGYATDAGKSSGKWYFFIETIDPTVSATGLIRNGTSQIFSTFSHFAQFNTLNTPRVIYVDLDTGAFEITNTSGTSLLTSTISLNGDTFYPGVSVHDPNLPAEGIAKLSFNPNYTAATIKPGYSVWTKTV